MQPLGMLHFFIELNLSFISSSSCLQSMELKHHICFGQLWEKGMIGGVESVVWSLETSVCHKFPLGFVKFL